jgi:hypothetical protein
MALVTTFYTYPELDFGAFVGRQAA